MPIGSLVMVNGQLYGTTAYGGAFGRGAIYRLDPKNRAYTLAFGSGSIFQITP